MNGVSKLFEFIVDHGQLSLASRHFLVRRGWSSVDDTIQYDEDSHAENHPRQWCRDASAMSFFTVLPA